jgi:hypothetical protein
MQTYNSFIASIEANFATPHLQIRKFDEGFYQDLAVWMTKNELWPIMWIVPQDITHLPNSVSEYNLRIYFLDLLEKDETNERDVLSDQQQTARDFTNWLRENADSGFNLLRDPRTIPVKSIGMDFTAGWYTDISIEVNTEMTECAIPFDPSQFPPAPPQCEPCPLGSQVLSDTVTGCGVGDVISIMGTSTIGTPTTDNWSITYIAITQSGTTTSVQASLPWDDRLSFLVPCVGGYALP